jgi:hypothetical protein
MLFRTLVGALSLLALSCGASQSAKPTSAPQPSDGPRKEGDRVCATFSATAVDVGFTDVTSFALTSTVTCAVTHGELSCIDLFGSTPSSFGKGIVALGGGLRIMALTESGGLIASPRPASSEAKLRLGALHQVLAAWGRKPVSLTFFDDRLTLFDDHGEQRRFQLLSDARDEQLVARDPSFKESVKQATVSHSAFLPEYECALIGHDERCRAAHGSWERVAHEKPVRAIGGNCAVLEDDAISCFGKSLAAPTVVGRVATAIAVSTSDTSSGACTIDGTGHVVCIGDLGIGFDTRGFSPFAQAHVVPGIDGAVALEVLDGRACALGNDGHLRCFGCTRAHEAMRSLGSPRFPTEVEREPH